MMRSASSGLRIQHFLFLVLLWGSAVRAAGKDGGVFAKWSAIELSFPGPHARADGVPNPFAVRLTVTFTSPDGRTFRVPGFYDGDGRGGANGNIWKVRFCADTTGIWTWVSESDCAELHGHRGRFTVTPVPKTARGFRRWGRLEYTGTPENRIRYLKFRDGPYWLKAGCDDPENFLGGFRNYATAAQRRAAVDYLAGLGVNSLYIMTHNIGGDYNDVWPWLGSTPAAARKNAVADNVRFDIPRLTRWRRLFEYMQTRGVVPYLILEDDSAWTGYDHERYWREMIARFGDLPAILFNLGEEHNENYPLPVGLEQARRFRRLDPWKHPLAIHNVNAPTDAYIDCPYLDFTSIQTGHPGRVAGLESALEHNAIAVHWIERCVERKRRVLMVNFDEGRPELDRRAWWSAYIGGGVWEAHVLPPYDRPHRAWESTWKQLGGARTFMETLPFRRMQPHNELVLEGRAFCLANPGEVYALYLPAGGSVTIDLAAGSAYEAAWWNPANDRTGRFQNVHIVAGGRRRFSAPGTGDWALRIRVRKH